VSRLGCILIFIVLSAVIADLFLLQTCLMVLPMRCLATTTMIAMVDDATCQRCLCTMLQQPRPSLQEEIRGAVVALDDLIQSGAENIPLATVPHVGPGNPPFIH